MQSKQRVSPVNELRAMDFGSLVNTVRENSQQAADNKDKAKDGENNGKGLDVIEEEQLLQANNNNGEKQES